MKIYSNPPTGPDSKAVGWYIFGTAGHDMFGRVYVLNRVRPVTRWRVIRARLGWHEKDTLRSGFTNKPTLKDGAIIFDGTQEVRTHK